jgi:hypothetical protein
MSFIQLDKVLRGLMQFGTDNPGQPKRTSRWEINNVKGQPCVAVLVSGYTVIVCWNLSAEEGSKSQTFDFSQDWNTEPAAEFIRQKMLEIETKDSPILGG